MKNKHGFTLTELIIGISISAVVLLVIFSFLANVMSDFGKSRKKTEFITTLYDFTTKVNEYKGIFDNLQVIEGGGHDALFLYSTGSTGVIFGVVDPTTNTLDSIDNSTIYSQKFLGYKELTVGQVADRLTDSGSIYYYDFFGDKIFRDMYVSGFDLTQYNSGALVNLDLDLLMYYKDDLDGSSIADLTLEDIFQLVITF